MRSSLPTNDNISHRIRTPDKRSFGEEKFKIMAKEEIPLYCYDTEKPTIRLHASR